MAKLKIRTYPDPVLKKKAAPVTDFGPAMQKLFDDMITTMHASDGVGLAAPQIGISQQIFIACPTMRRGEEYVMVNTVIEKKSGSAVAAEGCLSLPGISGEIVRATKLRLTFQDHLGKKHTVEIEDFFARVIQHEMDHLNGILLIDHFKGAERERLIANYNTLKNKGM
ncbi:MAG: peptide deformylase [Candidatus Omnitrophica bacterium]|nr:peptide deformylase [Candidatus Omnitrophota bacterium]